jgi:hypothetical protein
MTQEQIALLTLMTRYCCVQDTIRDQIQDSGGFDEFAIDRQSFALHL